MDLRKNILTALLLAIGFVLHHVIPGTLGGMKFDLFLSFVFVSLLLNTTFKNAILTGLLGGILTAMTTTFPGGQLPNIVDKLVTCVVLFIIIKLMGELKAKKAVVGVIGLIGTLVSGSVFLASALYMVGLPAPFTALFVSIVIPTTLTNTFITVLVYEAVLNTLKVTGAKFV